MEAGLTRDWYLLRCKINRERWTGRLDERSAAIGLHIALQSNRRRQSEMFGSSSWTRTSDHSINSRTLYQLSYRGIRRAV